MFYAYRLPTGLTQLSGKAAYYANTADAYRDLYRHGSGLVWPMGRKVLSWVFKAEAFAAGTVLRQIEMANLLSYHAVEDVMSTGMVRWEVLNAFVMHGKTANVCDMKCGGDRQHFRSPAHVF